MVFVLTGSDNQFHIFREDVNSHTFQEIVPEEYFPEFYKCADIVTWIEIYYLNNKQEYVQLIFKSGDNYFIFGRRLTVLGTETGYVRLCRVCAKTKTILLNHSTNFISYVSHIKIYPENKTVPKPTFVKTLSKFERDQQNLNETLILNVVLTNTSVPSVLFR